MRLVPLFFLVAIFPGAVNGATFTLSGNEDPTCATGFVCAVNNTFNLTTNAFGGGYFRIVNSDPVTVSSLNFDLTYPDTNCPTGSPASVNLTIDTSFIGFYASGGLTVNERSNCNLKMPGIADFLLTLTFAPGVPTTTGIGPNFEFDVSLNNNGSTDPNGIGSWVPLATSTDTTGVPEPGTFAIAAAGMLLIAIGFRRATAPTSGTRGPKREL